MGNAGEMKGKCKGHEREIKGKWRRGNKRAMKGHEDEKCKQMKRKRGNEGEMSGR